MKIRNMGKLYGVGLGPGDPSLLTLRAVEVLRSVDRILSPKSDIVKGSLARSIVERAVGLKLADNIVIEEFVFPMTKNERVLQEAYGQAAERAIELVEKGEHIAYITIGDPSLYSTYGYFLAAVKQRRPQLPVETVPGVSAMNLAAALMQKPIAQGDERCAIIPGHEDLESFKRILDEYETVVLMKIGKTLPELVRFLKKIGRARDAALVSRAGLPDQKVLCGLDREEAGPSGYLSTMIITSGRS